MSDDRPEALRRLEQRLSRASDAAERLIAEATRASLGDRPPPAGWQTPPKDPPPARGELEALIAALQAMRGLVPPEVVERLAGALRELLLAARALIDFYLERLERPRDAGRNIQDIPID